VLTAIGNSISSFLGCELEWEKKIDKRWVWLHVEVELKEGLLDEIELKCDDFRWVQHIDYWRVPFRCFGFHEVGHLQVQCRRPYSQFPPFRKVWKRKATSDSDGSDQKEVLDEVSS
jgi:hypothetical protein